MTIPAIHARAILKERDWKGGTYHVALLNNPTFEGIVSAYTEFDAVREAVRIARGLGPLQDRWTINVRSNGPQGQGYYLAEVVPIPAVPLVDLKLVPSNPTEREGIDSRSHSFFTAKFALSEDSAVRRFHAEASAEDVPELLRLLRTAESRLEITDEMVERAARASFEVGTEDWTWDDVLREEADRAEYWRADARTILEAALSQKEN